MQPLLAGQQVLERIVGGVPDVGLRVDGQPRLPLGGQHVAGMEVGAQEQVSFIGCRQRAEQLDVVSGETAIEATSTGRDLRLELVRPGVAHDLKRSKPVTLTGFAPQPEQQAGDDLVLLGFGPTGQRGSRVAALEEQGDAVVELLDVVESDRAVAVPLPQPVGLVCPLWMSPGHLQDEVTPATACGRRPGGLPAGFEGSIQDERPALLQHGDDQGQRRQPRPPALPFGRLDQVARHAQWHRSRTSPQCPITSSKAGG